MDLPVVIETIDAPEKIAAALEVIYPMVREGLITLSDVLIVKYTHRHLNPLPADRLVGEVMTRDVAAIAQDASVYAAWKQMLQRRVKVLPVTDAGGQVVGILTDGDLLERGGIQQRFSVAVRLDATELEQELRALQNSPRQVAEVMTHPALAALESDTLGMVTPRMVRAGLKRLPVVDKDGKLVGMLSRLDILRQVADAAPPAGPEAPLPPSAARLVQQIMTTDIPMCHQDEDLAAIIEKFARSSSHRLIVVDAQGKAIGLISDSDVVARVQPARRGTILDALRQIGKPVPGQETAFDLMSPGPLTAEPDLEIVAAVKMMLAGARKWLVIIDEQGRPLGLVNRELLLEALASSFTA
jgi:CBS domain-containing protein